MWSKIKNWWENIRRTKPSPRYYRHITKSGKKETPLYLFGTPNAKEKKITEENLKLTSFKKQHIRKIFIRFLKEQKVYGDYIRSQRIVSKGKPYKWNYANAFDDLVSHYRWFEDEDKINFWLTFDNKWNKTLLQFFNKIER